MEPNYTYRATVRSIYDGDTLRVNIDCGFNLWQRNVSIRLKGVNAPEITGSERVQGTISRDWLRNKIPIGTDIILKTEKDTQEKYGRWLGTVYLNGVNLNEEMVRLGLAEKFM